MHLHLLYLRLYTQFLVNLQRIRESTGLWIVALEGELVILVDRVSPFVEEGQSVLHGGTFTAFGQLSHFLLVLAPYCLTLALSYPLF